MIPSRITAARVRSSCSIGSGQADEHLAHGALAEHDDQAGEPIRDRDDVDPADVGRPRLGRGDDRGRAVRGREDRRGEAEPLLARVLHLAELVPDHQLLDGRQGRVVGDRLDEVAVARVGRDATGRRVRVGQEAGRLEVGEDVAHGRARHAEAVALDERGRADGCRGVDVFLDDGPEDRLGARIQRAGGADASRHDLASGCPDGVSTLTARVLTKPSSRGCGVSTSRGNCATAGAAFRCLDSA